jgi:hypothetical protein
MWVALSSTDDTYLSTGPIAAPRTPVTGTIDYWPEVGPGARLSLALEW